MNKLSSEPLISVGITSSKEVLLNPSGEWNITVGDEETLFIPLNSDSRMNVRGVLFGKGFHWQKTSDCTCQGSFRLLNHLTPDGFKVINTLPLEKYISSVVASEMNPNAPVEFIKAHAIISRTWALRKINEVRECHTTKRLETNGIWTWEESDSHLNFNVCSDDHCQRYQGISEREASIAEALSRVKGLVLTDSEDGSLADARFSKCCGGITEVFSSCWADRHYNYLKRIEDPYCNPDYLGTDKSEELLDKILKDYDRKTSYYYWKQAVPRSLIKNNLHKYHGINIGDVVSLEPLKRGASGRITQLRVIGALGFIDIGKELAIRKLLSQNHLYSSWFETYSENEDEFILKGRGWGHGVGLCQIGAAVMAAEGKSYVEILNFYYPGTSIEEIY